MPTNGNVSPTTATDVEKRWKFATPLSERHCKPRAGPAPWPEPISDSNSRGRKNVTMKELDDALTRHLKHSVLQTARAMKMRGHHLP